MTSSDSNDLLCIFLFRFHCLLVIKNKHVRSYDVTVHRGVIYKRTSLINAQRVCSPSSKAPLLVFGHSCIDDSAYRTEECTSRVRLNPSMKNDANSITQW